MLATVAQLTGHNKKRGMQEKWLKAATYHLTMLTLSRHSVLQAFDI